MGTIKKGILGGFSGKVGTVVGASWKGIDYIRSLPQSVRNPRTEGQVNQRNKFSTVINFLTKITPIIRTGFKDYAVGQSAFNAAMSYNLLNAVKGSKGDFEMDYTKVLVSRGNLYRPSNGSVTFADGKIKAEWYVEFVSNASPYDRVMILAFNSTRNESIYDNDVTERGEGAASIEIPDYWEGDKVEVFIAMTSEDKELVSNSLYLGQQEIPAN